VSDLIDKIDWLLGVLENEGPLSFRRELLCSMSDDELAELLRLAKLGQDAEKGFDNDQYFKCEKRYNSSLCTVGEGTCAWEDFCKLRSEQALSTEPEEVGND